MLIITLIVGVMVTEAILAGSVSKNTSPYVQGSQPNIIPVSTPHSGNINAAIGNGTQTDDKKIEKVQTYKSRVENTPIAFDTQYVYDDTREEKDSYISVEGVEGMLESTYNDEYEGDVFVATTLVSENTMTAPIDEVIVVGTKVSAGSSESNSSGQQPATQEVAVPQGNYDDGLARSMFDAMNDIRERNGLSRLRWSNQLYDYAKIRAQEISVVFDHRRPDGSAWDSLNPDVIYAENLATKAYKVNVAMDALMNSPTHRKNILSEFPMGSVAVFKASNGEWYWVQLFGY